MRPSEEFSAAASYLSKASSLSHVSTTIRLEVLGCLLRCTKTGSSDYPHVIFQQLYGLFKFVTVSHTPTTSKPGLLDFTGRAKWDSWQNLGKRYSTQSDPDGAAQARYLEIAKSLGWKPGATTDGSSLDYDTGDDNGSTKGIITGTGVFVSTMSTPKGDINDLDTIHGLAIAGDTQRLEKMLKANPSLDVNQKDEFVSLFIARVSQFKDRRLCSVRDTQLCI